MVKKLGFKPCNLCGNPVAGIKRPDKNAFRYPKRCDTCGKKWDKEKKEDRIQNANEKREHYLLPLGSLRLHKSSDNLTYMDVKVAQPNEWEYEHRHIVQTLLQRKLGKFEHVHHKDRNTLNNDPSNLEVLSITAHNKEHHCLLGKWAVKYDCCLVCSTNERKHTGLGLCSACYQKR